MKKMVEIGELLKAAEANIEESAHAAAGGDVNDARDSATGAYFFISFVERCCGIVPYGDFDTLDDLRRRIEDIQAVLEKEEAEIDKLAADLKGDDDYCENLTQYIWNIATSSTELDTVAKKIKFLLKEGYDLNDIKEIAEDALAETC